MYWFVYSFALTIGTIVLLGGTAWLHRRGYQKLINLNLFLLSLFVTLMLIELGFKLFFAQSDGFRYTLASQN